MDLLCGEELAYFRCQGRNMEDGSNNYLGEKGPWKAGSFRPFHSHMAYHPDSE